MSNLDSILSQVFRLKIEDLRDDGTMDNIERWDSLTHMDLITSIEEAFGIELSMDEIMVMRSINLVRKTVDEKIANK